MAGDWIKMRTNLRDDPTVDQLAEFMGVDDLTVIGMLFAFWAWADEYAVDGRVDGATSRLVTRKVRDGSNFAEALVKVGWLKFDNRGATIPNFDRHNGDSAKERSLKNQRQKRWRAGKNVDDTVDSESSTQASTSPSTGASTREEKRRVHVKSQEPPSSPSRAKGKIHPVPDGFVEFWSVYPRKDAKANAQKSYGKTTEAERRVIATVLPQFAGSWKWKNEPEFVPHAATWLNQRRWEDEPPPSEPPRQQAPQPKQSRQAAIAETLLRDSRYAHTAARQSGLALSHGDRRPADADAVVATISAGRGHDPIDSDGMD